ncbi:MAG: hypothetical protein AAF608_11875 [Pseudomonadota bacterium]
MIYQQNTLGGDVVAYDDKDGDREVARWSPGQPLTPDSIVLSADHKTLFANAANRFELWNDPTAAPDSRFYALDSSTLEEQWNVPLLGQVEHFAASPDKRYVYNSHYDKKLVSKVDTETREVTNIIIPDYGGHKVRVTSDGTRAYVGSIVWASLVEIDTEKNTYTRQLTFDDNVRPFSVSKDGKFAYVQLNRFHGFHVVDLGAWKVVDTVEGPGKDGAYPGHENRYPFTCDHGMEITPDEKYLITLATTGHFACFYSYPDLKLVKVIETGQQPSYLTVSKDSTKAYISCRISNTLMVIDLADLSVERTLEDVGIFPQRVCVDH